MFNLDNNQEQEPNKRNVSSKEKLKSISDTTDVLVYGSASSDLKIKDKEMDKLINNTLKSTIKNQFGNTNKPLEYFSLSMLNNLWSKTEQGSSGNKKNRKDFEEVLKEYVNDNAGADTYLERIKYENYRNIYTHLPAAHVALNIYKSSILSPEALTDDPINFVYDSNDLNVKKIVEQRVKYRIIDKYKLNDELDGIVKEALIDGVSYRAVISIEKDMENILKDKKILTEDTKYALDENYISQDVKFYDAEISKEQVVAFNMAIRESVEGYKNVISKFTDPKFSAESSDRAKSLLEELNNIIVKKTDDKKEELIEYSGAQIGRFAKDLINNNIVIKSKYDFMKDYTDALSEGYMIDGPNDPNNPAIGLKESYDMENKSNKSTMFLNGSKILKLEPEKVTPVRIGGMTIGYIYSERDMSNSEGLTYNAGVGGSSANLSQTGPTSYGMNSYGAHGLAGAGSNPLTLFGAKQVANNDHIVNLFINGLGKKLNKNFIKNNKEMKELIHELLREKYITQKKVNITFFSSDDIIETRVKPLFEGSEFFAKLYLAELTNNITISLGRGMDRRMIKVPFGLDDDMYQTVQDAIRTFKTREFSVGSIDESSISNLVRTSPGRYEDIYVPVAPDGTLGYDIDILPGMDNSKSSELLPQLRNQFLDSINIPASAIDSTAEMDFSRSVALRNIYFSKEIVDYQKKFNESTTQMIRKIYGDEYRYIGNKENEEANISIDLFRAWFTKPNSLNVATTLESLQNVEMYANTIINVIADLTDPTNESRVRALKLKIFKDNISYIPWDEYEAFYKDNKTDAKINQIKNSGKKGDPNTDDPNNFNPGLY